MDLDSSTARKPFRLWPGVVAVVLLWSLKYGVPMVVSQGMLFAVAGEFFGALAVVVWWLFFSRVPWPDRVGAIVLMIVALVATSRIVHESIANGMMGMLLPIYAIPLLSLALVAGAVASRRMSSGPRRASMVAAILLGCSVFTLLRTSGITGEAGSDFHWRWTETPEERLLAGVEETPAVPTAAAAAPADTRRPTETSDQTTRLPSAPPSAPAAAKIHEKTGPDRAEAKTHADWSGFRGPERDGIVHGVRIEIDWSRSAPVELWRRPIGPGWSSFAVHDNLLYTQEQRGDDEVVSCYNLATGAPVWRHRDAVRFWESNAGAGPRSTPTFSNGRVYTLGATGILNALEARDGALVWSRDAAADTHTKIPGWGLASSPLVVADAVIIATAGKLAAYDLATGTPRWFGPAGGMGYSSPHRVTIGGVEQILLLSGGGATSVAPADGTVLWEHRAPESGGNIVQPVLIADGGVLIGAIDNSASGSGTRRIAIAHGPGGWTVDERWTSTGLKPSFNDVVVHKGHAYGFDGSILASIDLENGKRNWKGGRYGHGQLVLLADQDLLLVLSEEGELALVPAAPDHFTELARFPAIEGKTWNHPVLVGDVLLVRNGQEMAAFRLSLATR